MEPTPRSSAGLPRTDADPDGPDREADAPSRRTRTIRPGSFALALLPLMLGGCYSLRPVEPATLTPGEEVVVHLGVAASQRLSQEEGYEVRDLSGRLESLDESQLTLSVQSGRRVQGIMMDNTRRVFTLPRPDVVLVERRLFDAPRSALVGGAILGVVVWGILQISGDGGGAPDDGGEPPPPPPSRIWPVPR